jgi:hypothetical protein
VGVSKESHGWLLWESGTKNVQQGALVVFHKDNLPLQALDVNSVEAIVNSIQVQGLGDFTQLKEFDIQDLFISSKSSILSLISNAPETYHQAITSENSSEWLEACYIEIGMMIKLGVWFEVPREEADEILNCHHCQKTNLGWLHLILYRKWPSEANSVLDQPMQSLNRFKIG